MAGLNRAAKRPDEVVVDTVVGHLALQGAGAGTDQAALDGDDGVLRHVSLAAGEERDLTQGEDGYIDTEASDATGRPDQRVWAVEYDAISGWVRTGTIRVEATRHVEIAGLSYAVSG